MVVAHEGARELRTMKWGLLPHWAKDAKIAARMINARLETDSKSPPILAISSATGVLFPRLASSNGIKKRTST